MKIEELDESLEFQPKEYIKCKTSDSRRVAYRILVQIMQNNHNVMRLLLKEGFGNLVDIIPIPSAWKFNPVMNNRSLHKYSGIKNLGAICYMNSSIQ